MLGYEHVLLQSVEKESIEQCSEPRKHGNTIGIYIYIHNGNITNNVFFFVDFTQHVRPLY